MARAAFVVCLLAAAYAVALAAPGLQVDIQFDNKASSVKNEIRTVVKEIADKLCRVPKNAVFLYSLKDQSTTFNHKSTGTFVCLGDPAKIKSNCNGLWNRHQVKDEIKDATTPDVEVQKITCGAAVNFTPTSGRKMQ